jgi:hypothetical protein
MRFGGRFNLGARLFAVGMSVVTAGACAGCRSFGAARLPGDQFDYNEALSRSVNEQMLLNIVRLRYSEPPVFLAANSILTQYVYSGSVGAEGAGGASLGDPLWSVGGGVNGLYMERPTITYTPLSGAEFAAQLITPVPSDLVFGLIESGWPPEHLLAMTVVRINDLQNTTFVPVKPAEEEGPGETFGNVIGLLVEVARRGAMEMERGDDGARYLVFREAADEQTAELITRLKSAVGLASDGFRFRVTTRIVRRGPDEVTLRVRSVLELVGYLGRGVQIPEDHAAQSRAIALPAGGDGVPLRVWSQEEPPADAFVAVQHQGRWFFVRQSDHRSKQAFSLLVYLFQMQAPQMKGAGPLLTVPTG